MHECDDHRRAFDPVGWRIGSLEVSGPFYDTTLVIEIMSSQDGAARMRLTRWQAEALEAEIRRRLAMRGPT
jgi:hypothetical protein